jgi:allophanate hydrolase subunit 2
VAGPRDDWFEEGALDVLVGATWTVTPASDRVGVRLDGPPLVRRDPARELASEPVVTGALQVPPSGRPVVLGPDRPTTGGYPVVAVVVDADLDRLAQARPGDPLSFTLANWP